jgi:hypothetical protein
LLLLPVAAQLLLQLRGWHRAGPLLLLLLLALGGCAAVEVAQQYRLRNGQVVWQLLKEAWVAGQVKAAATGVCTKALCTERRATSTNGGWLQKTGCEHSQQTRSETPQVLPEAVSYAYGAQRATGGIRSLGGCAFGGLLTFSTRLFLWGIGAGSGGLNHQQL